MEVNKAGFIYFAHVPFLEVFLSLIKVGNLASLHYKGPEAHRIRPKALSYNNRVTAAGQRRTCTGLSPCIPLPS